MSRLRKVVGARQGLGDWAGQLATAFLMLTAIVYFALLYLAIQPQGHQGWSGFLAAGYVRVPLTVAIFAVVWHAWLGTKSILMDYIKWPWYRIVKYLGTICYLVICTVWLLATIWSI